MVLNGSLCVILCWGKTGSDREHFQVPDSLREVKTLGSVEGWIPSDGLPQILTDLRFSSVFRAVSTSSPEKGFGLEAVHFSRFANS